MKINENNILQNKESVYECWQPMLCTLLYGSWRGPSHVNPLFYLLLPLGHHLGKYLVFRYSAKLMWSKKLVGHSWGKNCEEKSWFKFINQVTLSGLDGKKECINASSASLPFSSFLFFFIRGQKQNRQKVKWMYVHKWDQATVPWHILCLLWL